MSYVYIIVFSYINLHVQENRIILTVLGVVIKLLEWFDH